MTNLIGEHNYREKNILHCLVSDYMKNMLWIKRNWKVVVSCHTCVLQQNVTHSIMSYINTGRGYFGFPFLETKYRVGDLAIEFFNTYIHLQSLVGRSATVAEFVGQQLS